MPELAEQTSSDARIWFRTERRAGLLKLILGGDWIVEEAAVIDGALRALDLGTEREADFDASAITRLDSTGAWLIRRTVHELEERGAKIRGISVPQQFTPLIEALMKREVPVRQSFRSRRNFVDLLERMGRGAYEFVQQGYRMLGFLGRTTVEAGEALIRPDRELPWAAFVNQIEETGFTALPILGLLSFLLGVVLAYQGADQLSRFGAEVFTVNLVGISMLREVGSLMAAIIVAGRSGSAFTAQIGTMKLNQEIDAMETIGLNTVEVLVLPRVLGLMVALPLLTFYANIMGLIGGAVMCYFDLGITVPAFLRQLHDALAVNNWSFWLGMIKAPVFAFIIALVGCFEGLRVEGNAGSVGRQTTRSVVESIFLVIVFDAGFSVLFSLLEI